MTKVELFELIRQEHILHGKSVRHLSRELKVHRRLLRQALHSSIPPPRKRSVREPTVLTPLLRGIIDSWMRADREAPRKQRHTARKIFRRLREEHGHAGSERTVSRYVHRKRREIGDVDEVFVLQVHSSGEEGEVDWYRRPESRESRCQKPIFRLVFAGGSIISRIASKMILILSSWTACFRSRSSSRRESTAMDEAARRSATKALMMATFIMIARFSGRWTASRRLVP